MFIFEVLLEALLCGDTEFPSDQFSDRYSDLKQPNPFTDKPYIKEQLRVSPTHQCNFRKLRHR